MAKGATQPEKLPIELMSAIPPAAAVPANSIGGNCQNGAPALTPPMVPRTDRETHKQDNS